MREPAHIVFFDGPCNLCNSTVRFLSKNDQRGKLIYSSLQSEFAMRFLMEKNISNDFNSIIFCSGTKIYKKALAIQEILALLTWKCQIMSILLKCIPLFIKNRAYDLISSKRSLIFKKSNSCALLPVEIRERMLTN